MNRLGKQCAAFVLAFALVFTSGNMIGLSMETTYAATTQTITRSTTVVCNKSANVKAPKGYRNCKFSSSNAKVASVDARGKLEALRLGVTTITVKSGAKTKKYTVTVIPAKKSDVRLNQELILIGQKFQLKLVSDKYDTSQVKLYVNSAFDEIDHKGNCNFKKSDYYQSSGSLSYSYGKFTKNITLYVCDKEVIMDEIVPTDTWGSEDIWAGVSYDTSSLKWEIYDKPYNYKQLKNKGIEIQIDGKPLPDTVVYTPGEHTFTIVAGINQYSQKAVVTYSVKDALVKKDATGYANDGKEVFDAAFAAVNQVVKDGMSEEEKVKAIHDYLIYSANYVNNGDYQHAEKWASGAGGVLIHKEGVCNSYAIAFYMMAVSAGLDCRYVTGTADGGGHAWNQVKVDGKWYYIDCTWDDPIMNGHSGGGEGYEYYLSETLWSDHTVEESKDLADDGKYYWEHYYLTGKDY